MLYIFSGLPGTGKSTLSSALAKELGAMYLRVDVVEQALRDAGLVLPTWEQVREREYEVWDRNHMVIDTANKTVAESMMILIDQLNLEHNKYS